MEDHPSYLYHSSPESWRSDIRNSGHIAGTDMIEGIKEVMRRTGFSFREAFALLESYGKIILKGKLYYFDPKYEDAIESALNTAFSQNPAEGNRKVNSVFKELKEATEQINISKMGTGIMLKGAYRSHVNGNMSDHELQEIIRRNELLHLKFSTLKDITELIKRFVDSERHFTDYKSMIKELDELLRNSIKNEEYERTATYGTWRLKLPNP